MQDSAAKENGRTRKRCALTYSTKAVSEMNLRGRGLRITFIPHYENKRAAEETSTTAALANASE